MALKDTMLLTVCLSLLRLDFLKKYKSAVCVSIDPKPVINKVAKKSCLISINTPV